ncbi:hypothetical protein GCM10010277_66270 [Streptomyces longisporoflavus]|nr:hypothetical protein GCM10010277_66270 [Streptomyces longisporoflavus]
MSGNSRRRYVRDVAVLPREAQEACVGVSAVVVAVADPGPPVWGYVFPIPLNGGCRNRYRILIVILICFPVEFQNWPELDGVIHRASRTEKRNGAISAYET